MFYPAGRRSENARLRRYPHPRPVKFSLRETAEPLEQGKSLQRTEDCINNRTVHVVEFRAPGVEEIRKVNQRQRDYEFAGLKVGNNIIALAACFALPAIVQTA